MTDTSLDESIEEMRKTLQRIQEKTSEDDLAEINYLEEFQDMTRITHETSLIRKVPSKENLPNQLPDRYINELNQEIQRRKQIMAGLDLEISELRKLLEDYGHTPRH